MLERYRNTVIRILMNTRIKIECVVLVLLNIAHMRETANLE